MLNCSFASAIYIWSSSSCRSRYRCRRRPFYLLLFKSANRFWSTPVIEEKSPPLQRKYWFHRQLLLLLLLRQPIRGKIYIKLHRILYNLVWGARKSEEDRLCICICIICAQRTGIVRSWLRIRILSLLLFNKLLNTTTRIAYL